MDQNTRQIHKGGPPWMCDQHNVRASAGDSTGQNIDTGHTPNPRIGIKICDPAWNRTRDAGLESRDSTDHATATDLVQVSHCFFNCNMNRVPYIETTMKYSEGAYSYPTFFLIIF